MDKIEAAQICALLSVFYGKPKADPEETANGWHWLLQEYQYEDAEKAVKDFIRQDTRDYATFPTPGVIINIIEKTAEEKKKRLYRVWNGMYDRLPYEQLPAECKELCPQDVYERGMDMDAEELIAKRNVFLQYVRKNQKLLGA